METVNHVTQNKEFKHRWLFLYLIGKTFSREEFFFRGISFLEFESWSRWKISRNTTTMFIFHKSRFFSLIISLSSFKARNLPICEIKFLLVKISSQISNLKFSKYFLRERHSSQNESVTLMKDHNILNS